MVARYCILDGYWVAGIERLLTLTISLKVCPDFFHRKNPKNILYHNFYNIAKRFRKTISLIANLNTHLCTYAYSL